MAARGPTEDIARLGDEIYERDIRREVEADHHGEVLAIDINSRCWALGDTVTAARDRLRAERPDAVNVLFQRVGSRAIDRFGRGSSGAGVTYGAPSAKSSPGRSRWSRLSGCEASITKSQSSGSALISPSTM